MADPIVEKAQAWLREHEQDLLDDTRRMLRIPSVETAAEPGAPFGKANREALDLALNLANTWGMRTKDLDGYCGYAEFGKGEKLIVSLGHLDVVPVSSGWKHGPFGAEIDGEYVYARGSVDDKGPTMASFYAARALMEVAGNLGARVRIVFGCDEESGFQCVHRYVQTEEAPTYGIAPDSDWPLIHAEKGICDLHVEVPLPTGEFALMEANGGQRPNIVIDACSATVRVGLAPEPTSTRNWPMRGTATWRSAGMAICCVSRRSARHATARSPLAATRRPSGSSGSLRFSRL